jgi:hypothetical protein
MTLRRQPAAATAEPDCRARRSGAKPQAQESRRPMSQVTNCGGPAAVATLPTTRVTGRRRRGGARRRDDTAVGRLRLCTPVACACGPVGVTASHKNGQSAAARVARRNATSTARCLSKPRAGLELIIWWVAAAYHQRILIGSGGTI